MGIHKDKQLIIVDVLCLQIAWFTAAILHDSATPWMLTILLFRLLVSRRTSSEIVSVGKLAATGLVFESALILAGVYSYNSALFIPLWLPVLWLLFAFSLANSMRWIGTLAWQFQTLVGALAGALSYQAAASMKALEPLVEPLTFIALLAFCWAIALPMFLYQSRQLREGDLC